MALVVTLVVAFGFLPQNFGRWWETSNGILSFYECRFSGVGTFKPSLTYAKGFELVASTGGEDAKTLREARTIVLSNEEFLIKIIRLFTSFGQVDNSFSSIL